MAGRLRLLRRQGNTQADRGYLILSFFIAYVNVECSVLLKLY